MARLEFLAEAYHRACGNYPQERYFAVGNNGMAPLIAPIDAQKYDPITVSGSGPACFVRSSGEMVVAAVTIFGS